MGVITLLTDFGTRDEYAGVMKGVILSISPEATVVDISHQVERHDVRQAGHMLHAAYRYFPAGTVHTVVVDPGVGGKRAAIAFAAGRHFFLGPDNGVFSPVLSHVEPEEIVKVENGEFFLSPLSQTFHGRDIFAPVAARLSGGLALSRLGPFLSRRQLNHLEAPGPVVGEKGQIAGRIVAVDHFGNLITNIRAEDLNRFRSLRADLTLLFVVAGRHRILGLSHSYECTAAPQPLAIVGSRGFVEIAVNRQSAREILNAKIGDPIQVAPAVAGSDGHRPG